MKRYFLLFGSFYFLFLPPSGRAQDSRPGGWSVAISGGMRYAASTSMRGDISSYEAAVGGGATPAQYPFGSNRAYGASYGVEAEYRIIGSEFSLYGQASEASFTAGNGFRNSAQGRYTMTIASLAAGIEYTFGQTYQIWNFYGRIGIVPSAISGSNRSGNGNRIFFDSLRYSSLDSRLGMEIEIGERYHIPRWPIGIEASLNYTNINLFGKSYTTPVTPGALFGGTGSINDGKNPNDPNDKPRTIDFFSFRVGARFYF